MQMMKFNLIALLCLIFSTSVLAETDIVIKEKWLESIKPSEIHWHCHGATSPIKRNLKGSTTDCELKVAKLFDYCASSVLNVQLPEQLTTEKEGRKYGAIVGQCIGAYYFGGAHLEVFNFAQNSKK